MMTQYEAKSRAHNVINAMVKFARTEFNIPDFSCITKLSFSTRRVRSNGGITGTWGNIKGRVSIQMTRYSTPGMHNYFEYDQIKNHPTIGNFTADNTVCVDATLAHEVAHAIDWYLVYAHKNDQNDRCKVSHDFYHGREFRGHARRWQYIYHVLREKFVNHRINRTPVTVSVAPPKPVAPKTVTTYSGTTNIAKVVSMYRANKHRHDYWLLNEIMTMLGVKRGNAHIYLAKAKARA